MVISRNEGPEAEVLSTALRKLVMEGQTNGGPRDVLLKVWLQQGKRDYSGRLDS